MGFPFLHNKVQGFLKGCPKSTSLSRNTWQRAYRKGDYHYFQLRHKNSRKRQTEWSIMEAIGMNF
jgi:hypothetical protein